MSTSTKDFINKLSELKKEFKVFIPSIKKEVTAKQITLKQQKDIISTAVNGVLGALQFTKAVNELIIKNVDSDTLFTFDRIPALLALRVESLGDKIKIDDGDVVSLKDSLLKAKEVPPFKLTKKVKIGSINVELRIPTLQEENIILKKCIQEIDNLKSENLSEAMGLIYIFELIKTIKSVQVEACRRRAATAPGVLAAPRGAGTGKRRPALLGRAAATRSGPAAESPGLRPQPCRGQ